jgi:menaquinone-dependent protoporphyrinogen IX oxidase
MRTSHLAGIDLPDFHDYQHIEPRIANVITACFQIYTKIKIGSSVREVHYHNELNRIYAAV